MTLHSPLLIIMYCLIGQESVMTSLNWQIGLQTKHCRALCTFGRTSKCTLGFLTYCLWAYTTSKLQIFSQRNGVYFYETKNWHLTNKQPKLLTIFVWESSVGSFRFVSGCYMIRSALSQRIICSIILCVTRNYSASGVRYKAHHLKLHKYKHDAYCKRDI